MWFKIDPDMLNLALNLTILVCIILGLTLFSVFLVKLTVRAWRSDESKCENCGCTFDACSYCGYETWEDEWDDVSRCDWRVDEEDDLK